MGHAPKFDHGLETKAMVGIEDTIGFAEVIDWFTVDLSINPNIVMQDPVLPDPAEADISDRFDNLCLKLVSPSIAGL